VSEESESEEKEDGAGPDMHRKNEVFSDDYGWAEGFMSFEGQKILRPDEIDEKTKVNLMSGMDKLIMSVMNKARNSRVYVNLKTGVSTFQAEFIITAMVGDGFFTGTYLTSKLAIGISDKQVIRESDIILKALVADLAERAFTNGISTFSDVPAIDTRSIRQLTF
jgi:hypothetical protein